MQREIKKICILDIEDEEKKKKKKKIQLKKCCHRLAIK